MRGLGLDFTNPVGTQGECWTCVCVLVVGGVWVVYVGRGVGGLGPGSGGVGWVLLSVCEVRVWILCVDGRSRYLCIVLGGYLRILGAPSVQSCCTLWISASLHVFVYSRDHNSRLVCVML